MHVKRRGMVVAWLCAAGWCAAGWCAVQRPPLACGDEADAWWSLRPLVAPTVPELPPGGHNEIDAFVHRALAERGWSPSPEADRATLIRRLSFDLIGLPPTPEEVARFETDRDPLAYERLVDRLLASPRYGERWARHWLDAIHFAETHGHDQDRVREYAWPYRDYVIGALNSDKPYGRFVAEQVAGDVLYPAAPQGTVALGFLAAGPWDESSLRDVREDSLDHFIGQYVDRDDIIANVMNNFVGMTVQCARCHDHKFDPISQDDYYALQAVFAGVGRANRPFDLDPQVHMRRQAFLRRLERLNAPDETTRQALLSAEAEARVERWEAAWKTKTSTPAPTEVPPAAAARAADADQPPAQELPAGIGNILAVPRSERNEDQRLALSQYVGQAELKASLAELPAPSWVYAVASDFAPEGGHKPPLGPYTIHVLNRGDIRHPLQEASPGALSCVRAIPARFALANMADESSRRAALARWLTSPAHPLTWRAIVNRAWGRHFGQGLVDTPNDLGEMGSSPSHPELLDWLAVWFRDGDQSLKALHRLMVQSAAYRQQSSAASPSSASQPSAAEGDPANRWLWRMHRRRLDAECVRDALLAASQDLDLRMGGPSDRQFDMQPGRHVTPLVNYAQFAPHSPLARRRSIYRFLFRTLPDPFMESLDCPAGDQFAPVRTNSVTVQQALAMWNNAFVLHQCERLAGRLETSASTLADQIALAFRLAIQREPTPDELQDFCRYAQRHGLANMCRVLINSNEFMFVD